MCCREYLARQCVQRNDKHTLYNVEVSFSSAMPDSDFLIFALNQNERKYLWNFLVGQGSC